MQSRRDQLQAYRFLVRRALAALVTGQPDVAEAPMRRLTVTTISGLMIAVLVAAGFGVYGLIKPGSTSKWRQNGTIVVERETGARYVYYDSELHPTLNYASAVLASGSKSPPSVQLVARSKLAGTPRSPLIGIDGLPDSVPSANQLVRGPWTVCSQLAAGPATSAADVATVTLTVGSSSGAIALDSDAGIAVTTPGTSTAFLLWHGQRLQVESSDVASALGLSAAPTVAVGTALLESLPVGPALRHPDVPHNGAPGPSVGGRPTAVGQLLRIDQRAYAVVLAGGIHDVTAVEAALLQTVLVNGHRLDPVDTTESVALGLSQSPADWAQLNRQFTGLPSAVPGYDPRPAQHGGVCALFADGGAPPALAATAGTPPSLGTSTISQSAASAAGRADTVAVSPGHAALARAVAGSPTAYLVADPGRKFPIGSPPGDILAAFGYGAVQPVRLSEPLLSLLPTGPALDPTAARTPVTG